MQKSLTNNIRQDKIRLLIVLNTLGLGGAEVLVARTAPHFDKEKFEVHIAYYSKLYQGYPNKMLTDAGIKVTFLDRNRWGRIPYFFKVARFMRQHRFDIVHAWSGTANLYARVPAIIAGVPCIIGGLLGQRAANGPFGILFSLTNWRCSGWIVNSLVLKELVQQRVKFIKQSPIYVVPNGLEVDDKIKFSKDKDKDSFYDSLKSNKPIIGTVGRLAAVKNQLLFIQMAKNLRDMGAEADFWIIGEGPMRPALEKAIKENKLENCVRLLGYRTDLDAALSRMDMFVLTSNSEGCPNSLLEAMRASLPVVSTNCTYLNEIIEDGINGFISPKGDSLSLARKLKIILDDPLKRKKMGRRSREIIKERFAMPIAIERLQNVYIECLKRCSSRRPEVLDKLKWLGYSGE